MFSDGSLLQNITFDTELKITYTTIKLGLFHYTSTARNKLLTLQGEARASVCCNPATRGAEDAAHDDDEDDGAVKSL